MGKRIVVSGSSFGGFNAAVALRYSLGPTDDVTVVSSEKMFTFVPSLPWVAMGWKNPEDIQADVAVRLGKLGIKFIHDTIVKAEPDKCRVRGSAGEYDYDYLVAATGSELDFSAIPGMGPEGGNSYSIFNVHQAMQTKSALDALIERGSGHIVLGNAPGASCLGPVYELAMMMDTKLRGLKIRPKFKISLFTNEPFLGHFGVGGFGAMGRMMEDEFADRGIAWKTNAKLTQVLPDGVEFGDGDKWKSDFSLIVPAFFGSHAYMGIEGFSNPRGFIIGDDYLANPKYQNVYAVGVTLAIPPPAETPVAVGVPKTGQMTGAMAEAAAHNIVADIRGGAKKRGKDFSVICIADAGDTAFYISASPLLPPRNKLRHDRGRVYHWMKHAFERYYMAMVKYGAPKLEFGW
ncbi:MAG: FAD-dependent oxidoreductase [Nitrospinae bacterium]|nr:FAD-dependent oxidoreductase [Nitrospinota bacterium]